MFDALRVAQVHMQRGGRVAATRHAARHTR